MCFVVAKRVENIGPLFLCTFVQIAIIILIIKSLLLLSHCGGYIVINPLEGRLYGCMPSFVLGLVTKGMSLFVYKIKKCLALFNDTELGSFILDRFSHPPCHSIRMRVECVGGRGCMKRVSLMMMTYTLCLWNLLSIKIKSPNDVQCAFRGSAEVYRMALTQIPNTEWG